tara:strand:- start:907 stop:1161 length:255 start_codon:yes stop_codon:yes gene_type:complete
MRRLLSGSLRASKLIHHVMEPLIRSPIKNRKPKTVVVAVATPWPVCCVSRAPETSASPSGQVMMVMGLVRTNWAALGFHVPTLE